MRWVVAAAAFLVALMGGAEAQERTVPQTAAQVQLSFAPVVSKVAPAVVNVYSRRVVRQAVNPFFQQFFGASPMRSRVEQSLGSGVIVRADGVIVTNNHVIDGGQDIRVSLPDRREFEAKVILADARTDLAVLRIDTNGEKLPALAFGDSDKLQVGDLVLAIGDPFGVGQTVTSGIVSALARSNVGASDYQFFIQTDAAINPGNSGGALVTLDGRLIGINTSIYSQSGGNIGIGFAIPSNMTRVVVDGALGGGIKRPWLGADGQAVTADIAKSLGLSRPDGVLISQIYPGGPAAQAGLAKGDVVLSVDGFPVSDSNALRYRVVTHRAGEMVAVRYWRAGAMRDMMVRIALPSDIGREEGIIAGTNPMQGARVANITPALADEMQFDMMAKGVVVTGVAGGSQAARFGFKEGDIVRQINGEKIASVAQLKRALAANDEWAMSIQRGDQMMQLSVQ
ncbi:MAG TPA: DegQ family serine endoprotease [Micropepsaceae bacterium]|jgi:serine protease Do|nr:DegQ family serine endoprotease [Micropepsaceae bacterium]